MDRVGLGNFSLTRVVESDNPHLKAREVFPDWDDDLVKPHKSWLVPRHLNYAGDTLTMVIQSFLLKTAHHTILVDACGGDHKERKRPHFHQRQTGWLEKLASAGAEPEDIDYVLCTHMHVDHVGWNTKLEDGRWVPTFPNARYIFSRTEFDHWKDVTAKTGLIRTGDYFTDSVLPVVEAGRADLVETNHAIEDAVWFEHLPGHTPGGIGIHLQSLNVNAILCGDMMHHAIQCCFPNWSTNFCTDQEQARQTRRHFLETHADTDMLVIPAHFPGPTCGRIEHDGNAFAFRFLDED